MKKYVFALCSLKKIAVFFFVCTCFVFFAFFYNYHLYHIEQMQLFRLSRDYFVGYFNKPAVLSCYIGDFLTQFYCLKGGGAVVITCCLFLFWRMTDLVVAKFISSKYSFILPLILTAFVTCLHFDILYPLSATISLIIVSGTILFYTSLKKVRYRIINGVLMAPLLYFAAGYVIVLFLFSVLVYEIKLRQIRAWFMGVYFLSLVLLIGGLPMTLRAHYYLTPKQAYLFPFTKPIKPVPDFALETVLSLDCEWYFNHPQKTIELAQQTHLKSRFVTYYFNLPSFQQGSSCLHWLPFVTYYFNLASSFFSILPDKLLTFNQAGVWGQFIPLTNEQSYISLVFGNEVFYQIGDVNDAQHYALLANTFSPKSESSRMIRRLAEINIINGEYAAAEKYLKMLGQTLFYKGWARNMHQFLYNEEKCNQTPWIFYKRSQIPVRDFIKSSPNDIVGSLVHLLNDHPENKAALDYLLCMYLLYKDINSFYKVMTTWGGLYQADYHMPELYQEALLMYFSKHKDDKNRKQILFSDKVINQLMRYKEMYYQSKGNGKLLHKDFGKTYWFYFNFAVLPK